MTFVRSVDLDEWTQRQIDAMKLGGNENARKFFRKNGFTELYGNKSEKKYKSKAAVSYKAELSKAINIEAAKRGEVLEAASAAAEEADGLLQNLEISAEKDQQELAKKKLAAARMGGSAGVLKPQAKLASSMAGASKLSVPAGGMLRKPASSSGASKLMMKKKPSTSSNKLRINKLSMKLPGGSDDFEDIEATQKAAEEAERLAAQKKKEAEDAAKKAADEAEAAAKAAEAAAAAEANRLAEEAAKKPTMEDNMKKLQAMNGDFFSSF